MIIENRNKWIKYGLITVVFLGVAIAGMTSCMINAREANNQQAQAAYEEIKKDYDAGKFEDAQKKIGKLKKQYNDAPYTQKAIDDFKDIPDKIKQLKEQEKQAAAAKIKADEPKYKVISDGFNKSMSNYKVYAGFEVKGNLMKVYVNEDWNHLSKDMKTTFIKQCLTMWQEWYMIAGLDLNIETWNFQFIHKYSGRKVATWGNIMGASIND